MAPKTPIYMDTEQSSPDFKQYNHSSIESYVVTGQKFNLDDVIAEVEMPVRDKRKSQLGADQSCMSSQTPLSLSNLTPGMFQDTDSEAEDAVKPTKGFDSGSYNLYPTLQPGKFNENYIPAYQEGKSHSGYVDHRVSLDSKPSKGSLQASE